MRTPSGAVVVGFDGYVDSERALDWAIAEAEDRNRPLHIVTALQPGWRPPLVEYADRENRSAAHHLVRQAFDRAEASSVRSISTHVAAAPAAMALLRAAANAEMVVVGARRLGAVAGVVLGSVSQHVSRHARCPVVVVRAANPKATRVVVGVDGSPGSDHALSFAFDHASRRESPLVAVRCWRPSSDAWTGSELTVWGNVAEEAAVEERLLREQLAGWAEKYPDVEVTVQAIPDHPARVLADVSKNATLVVGFRGRGAFKGLLLGSVSQFVLNHAHCPVAVAR